MSNINPENGLNSQHNDDAEFDPYIAELSDQCVRLNGLSFVMPGTTILDTFPTPKPEEAKLMKRTFCGERVERGIITVSDHWLRCLKRTEGLIVCSPISNKNSLKLITT